MKKKAMKLKACFILVILVSAGALLQAQSIHDLPLDEQRTFFEGYWKYASENRDTVFVIKLKSLEKPSGRNSYIGSYLYRNPSFTENNISELDEYMHIETFDEYLAVKKSKRKGSAYLYKFNALLVSELNYYTLEWSCDVKQGRFYDYTKDHMNGWVTLTALSAKPGSETISWSLYLYGEIMYPEGEEEQYLKFSVPTEITLTKMYDLDEFADLGIVLSPFPPPRIVADIQE